MTGRIVDRLPHNTATCHSSRGLNVYYEEETGKYSGYCWSCNTYVSDPYGDSPPDKVPTKYTKTKEEIEEELNEVRSIGSRDLPERMLKKATLDYFGVRVGFDERTGQNNLVFFPYNGETKFKVRLLSPKKFWWVGDGGGKDANLFGWEKAKLTGAKKLYITEGEICAMSLFQTLKELTGDQWKHLDPAVVSIPCGAAAALRSISANIQEIRKHFKEIVIVMDMDEAGISARNEICRSYPEVKVVELPEKDVNDCLTKGYKKALYNAATFKLIEQKSSRIVSADSLFESAKEVTGWGLSYPWYSMTDKTRGLRFGETTYIGAPPKCGKSELVNALGAWFMIEHGLPVLMAKPEEANKKTVKMVAGKIAGCNFTDPKIEFDFDKYDLACKKMEGKLFLLDIYQHLGWETLKEDIKTAVNLYKVKIVFVDPLTNLSNGMSSSDANTKLQEIAQELAVMAKDLDIHIFIFCHLRNKEGGKQHNQGGEILTSEFAGSRSMERSCNYMWGLWLDKSPGRTEEEMNMRELRLLADREFGETCTVPLYWDRQTTLFKELT